MKEDNEQLATQYEREKCLRKASEQKLLEIEYASEEDRNDLQSKVMDRNRHVVTRRELCKSSSQLIKKVPNLTR